MLLTDVDAPLKGEGIATRIEGLTLDGDLDPDGIHITNLPLELSDDDLIKQDQSHQKSYTEKWFFHEIVLNLFSFHLCLYKVLFLDKLILSSW